jgi:hypothetical protein
VRYQAALHPGLLKFYPSREFHGNQTQVFW